MADEKPIRILRLIARLNIGGPAIQAITLTRHLAATCQTLLVCGQVGVNEGSMDYLASRHKVRPLVIPALGREISFLNDVKSFFFLIRTIRQYRPHIIHTHTAKAGTMGRAAAFFVNATRPAKDRIRLVHTFHGHIFHGYFGRGKTFMFICIERLLAKITDQIVVISFRQKKDICEKFKIADKKKVRIIPLGFNLSNFSQNDNWRVAVRSKYLSGAGDRVFLVGIIGRLTEIKNHLMLFEAIARLRATGKAHLFRFLVVGDGELRDELAATASRLKISEYVIFSGWQKDMAPIYSGLDAVVLTSRNEGTPVSLIEAMASLKPVLATRVGGVPDLLGKVQAQTASGMTVSEYGFLVPSEDAGALADALLFLLENKNLVEEKLEAAKAHVSRQYALERLLKDMASLYAELIKKPS
ncbi:MAG: glycosyltransferase [Desulfobacterales bacterium]|nr:glycosyltransferase [Desulfobacterales bacterium]